MAKPNLLVVHLFGYIDWAKPNPCRLVNIIGIIPGIIFSGTLRPEGRGSGSSSLNTLGVARSLVVAKRKVREI